MKRKIFFNFFYALFCTLILVSGCKKEEAAVGDEAIKDITGRWKIKTLIRNGEDMTERMDLSKFRIIFNADNSYTLEDKFAFAVDESGTYQLDDPQFPFKIVLTPQSSTEKATINFEFPVVEGKRELSLKLSPGCASNSYQYFFEREN